MTQPPDLESTAALLVRARDGDPAARDGLARRYHEILSRWAHGRVPAAARNLLDTGDLVQTTLMRAFDNLDRFEPRREGAFLAYLRQILLNRIRDVARRARRTPPMQELSDAFPDTRFRSPLEDVIGSESLSRYEKALTRLSERQREAIVLRLELGLRYREIAEALNADSVNAARLVVARALIRLAAAVGHDDDDQTGEAAR